MADDGSGEGFPWDRSPVPAEHQVRGLGPIVPSVPGLAPTDRHLRSALNMRPVREYPLRYFREPNGILLEIASDVPGFAVDEDETTLGERVALPPFLEALREAIVAPLKPLD